MADCDIDVFLNRIVETVDELVPVVASKLPLKSWDNEELYSALNNASMVRSNVQYLKSHYVEAQKQKQEGGQ